MTTGPNIEGKLFMLLWIAVILNLAWAKGPSLSPSSSEFQRLCYLNRSGAIGLRADSAPLGRVTFVPIGTLERLQSTFSFDRLRKGIDDLPGDVRETLKQGRFPYYNGSSIYPRHRAITAIRYNGRLYILDGHHRAFLSTYFGAKKIPVRIVDDWSTKSSDRFFADLRAQNLSYFYNLSGSWIGPGDFCNIIDDPLLFLARKLLRRIDFTYDRENDEIEIHKEGGARTPIALKLNRDFPFTEQEMARLLREDGVHWRSGDRITSRMLKRFLELFWENRDDSRLSQLLLLESPTPVAKLDVENLIREHFARVQCEYQVAPSDN